MRRDGERSQLTAVEYLAWEREQPNKHEFFHGEVFAMANESPRHNALGMSTGAELRAVLRSQGCAVLSSDQRLAFPPHERYVYPDVTVVCGPPAFQPETDDVIVNPTILVEVLSSSTEEYDRGPKWAGYQRIASLTDFLLVAQAEARIDHYRRNADGSWTYRTAGPGEQLELTGGGTFAVDAIYAGMFDAEFGSSPYSLAVRLSIVSTRIRICPGTWARNCRASAIRSSTVVASAMSRN